MPQTTGLVAPPSSAGVNIQAVLRWVYVLACLFAIGPVVLRVVARIHDAHGGHAATLLTDGAAGLVALGTVLGVCLVVGVIGARFFTLGVGAMGAGVVAAWGAWGCATIATIVRATSDASVFKPLAVEGLICGVAGAAMVWVFERVAMKSQPAGAEDQMAARVAEGGAIKKTKRALGGVVVMDRSAAIGPVLGAALVAAVVAAGLATYMVAISVLKGQVVAAAIAAGIAAGMASVYASQAARGVVSGVVPALGVAVLATAGPFVALMFDDRNLVQAAMTGSLNALARPIGLDWLAGILCGVPLGLSWAGLKLDVRAHQPGTMEPGSTSGAATMEGASASKGA